MAGKRCFTRQSFLKEWLSLLFLLTLAAIFSLADSLAFSA